MSAPKEWRDLIRLASVIVALWLLFWLVVVSAPLLDGWSERGQFGDMFGALNALFSGLALAGVIYALRLQMQELALQREEMQQSREELKRTADAQAAQVQLLTRQVAAMEDSLRAENERRRRETAPRFRFTGAPETGGVRRIGLENHGAEITSLEAASLGAYSVRLEPRDLLGHQQVLTAITTGGPAPLPNETSFILQYTDVLGSRRSVLVQVDSAGRTALTTPGE